MGLVWFVALAAGCGIGLAVSAFAAGYGVLTTRRLAPRRRQAWMAFALVGAGVMLTLLLVVSALPWAEPRPGSDWELAIRNALLQGLAKCLTPGLGALAGVVAVRLLRPSA